MMKKLLSIFLIMSLFSTICFGKDSGLSSDLNKKYDDGNFGRQIGFAVLCGFLGAAGGAAIWYAKTMKELNDIDQEYEDLDFEDLQSAEEWLENRKKDTEENAKDELGNWVLGGAVVGSVLGILLYPESDSYSLINFSTEQKTKIRIPRPNYNIQSKRIIIPLIKYNFK